MFGGRGSGRGGEDYWGIFIPAELHSSPRTLPQPGPPFSRHSPTQSRGCSPGSEEEGRRSRAHWGQRGAGCTQGLQTCLHQTGSGRGPGAARPGHMGCVPPRPAPGTRAPRGARPGGRGGRPRSPRGRRPCRGEPLYPRPQPARGRKAARSREVRAHTWLIARLFPGDATSRFCPLHRETRLPERAGGARGTSFHSHLNSAKGMLFA